MGVATPRKVLLVGRHGGVCLCRVSGSLYVRACVFPFVKRADCSVPGCRKQVLSQARAPHRPSPPAHHAQHGAPPSGTVLPTRRA